MVVLGRVQVENYTGSAQHRSVTCVLPLADGIANENTANGFFTVVNPLNDLVDRPAVWAPLGDRYFSGFYKRVKLKFRVVLAAGVDRATRADGVNYEYWGGDFSVAGTPRILNITDGPNTATPFNNANTHPAIIGALNSNRFGFQVRLDCELNNVAKTRWWKMATAGNMYGALFGPSVTTSGAVYLDSNYVGPIFVPRIGLHKSNENLSDFDVNRMVDTSQIIGRIYPEFSRPFPESNKPTKDDTDSLYFRMFYSTAQNDRVVEFTIQVGVGMATKHPTNYQIDIANRVDPRYTRCMSTMATPITFTISGPSVRLYTDFLHVKTEQSGRDTKITLVKPYQKRTDVRPGELDLLHINNERLLFGQLFVIRGVMFFDEDTTTYPLSAEEVATRAAIFNATRGTDAWVMAKCNGPSQIGWLDVQDAYGAPHCVIGRPGLEPGLPANNKISSDSDANKMAANQSLSHLDYLYNTQAARPTEAGENDPYTLFRVFQQRYRTSEQGGYQAHNRMWHLAGSMSADMRPYLLVWGHECYRPFHWAEESGLPCRWQNFGATVRNTDPFQIMPPEKSHNVDCWSVYLYADNRANFGTRLGKETLIESGGWVRPFAFRHNNQPVYSGEWFTCFVETHYSTDKFQYMTILSGDDFFVETVTPAHLFDVLARMHAPHPRITGNNIGPALWNWQKVRGDARHTYSLMEVYAATGDSKCLQQLAHKFISREIYFRQLYPGSTTVYAQDSEYYESDYQMGSPTNYQTGAGGATWTQKIDRETTGYRRVYTCWINVMLSAGWYFFYKYLTGRTYIDPSDESLFQQAIPLVKETLKKELETVTFHFTYKGPGGAYPNKWMVPAYMDIRWNQQQGDGLRRGYNDLFIPIPKDPEKWESPDGRETQTIINPLSVDPSDPEGTGWPYMSFSGQSAEGWSCFFAAYDFAVEEGLAELREAAKPLTILTDTMHGPPREGAYGWDTPSEKFMPDYIASVPSPFRDRTTDDDDIIIPGGRQEWEHGGSTGWNEPLSEGLRGPFVQGWEQGGRWRTPSTDDGGVGIPIPGQYVTEFYLDDITDTTSEWVMTGGINHDPVTKGIPIPEDFPEDPGGDGTQPKPEIVLEDLTPDSPTSQTHYFSSSPLWNNPRVQYNELIIPGPRVAYWRWIYTQTFGLKPTVGQGDFPDPRTIIQLSGEVSDVLVLPSVSIAEMPVRDADAVFPSGDDVVLRIPILDRDGSPYDLSAATAISWVMQKTVSDTSNRITKSLDSGITITAPDGGTVENVINVEIDHEDTVGLSDTFYQEVEITAYERRFTVMTGHITVEDTAL